MPRRDGTGPMGQGALTGRALGVCSDSKIAKYGPGIAGLGLGLGFACRYALRRKARSRRGLRRNKRFY